MSDVATAPITEHYPLSTAMALDTQTTSIMSSIMLSMATSRGLVHRRNERMKALKPTKQLTDLAISSVCAYDEGEHDDEDAQNFLFDFGDLGVAYLGWYPSGDNSLVWHTDTREKLDELRALFTVESGNMEEFEPEVEEDEIRVRFWYNSSDGPQQRARNLLAPTWDEIEENYNGDTREALASLMAMEEWDPTPGKLILWRSDPGTGKTYALRALCRTWAEWAIVSYICDPETLLQGNPSYLLEIATREDGDKWHLIILEDSGELLTPSASAEQGQGLSRLLNTVDGMLGQGLKVVFLITTNEDIKKLHEALSRPGRCAMDLEFALFDQAEAQAWLDKRGYDGKPVKGAHALADLYHLVSHQPVVHQGGNEKVIGFGVRMMDKFLDGPEEMEGDDWPLIEGWEGLPTDGGGVDVMEDD